MKIELKKLGFLDTVLTFAFLFLITTSLYLYTSGYRLKKSGTNNVNLEKTGMVSAKSIPDGASVYLNGKLYTATNDTVSGIEPGLYELKIVKNGFVEWIKEIEVFEELVTDITAVLVSQSPRIEPLTNTGAKNPSLSPTNTKIAYFSTESEEPGVWIIPLSGGTINIFKSSPSIAIEDTKFTKYSQGEKIIWSPDEKQLLINNENSNSYLIDLTDNSAQTIIDTETIINDWKEITLNKRLSFLKTIDLDDSIMQLATSDKSLWAPDEQKFMFTFQYEDTLEYRIFNLEDPLPVGEKRETIAFTTNVADAQPLIAWFSDSFHLITVESSGDVNKTVSLVRIDGTNKTEVYNSILSSDVIFSAPSGDKIIVLTSFKSGDQTDLYTIGIR